jgi:osmoprotectant transport system permease protein
VEIDWDWIGRHGDDIREATLQHLEIVLVTVAIAVVLWVPIGVLVRGRRLPLTGSTSAAALIYTIPSLALFAFLVPLTGIGRNTVIIGLVLYSPLILIRNTVVGLESVPAPVREAARGMGLTRRQILARVELPLALPAIFAGVRIVTVTTVGIATIGVLVGFEGLGSLIYTRGLNRDFLTPILVGGVVATAMAMILDGLLLALERLLTPWTRGVARR